MSDENQDLLDLCRLGLMEENVADSPAPDCKLTMDAIRWKKRQLAMKIINDAPEVTDEALNQHKAQQKEQP